MRHWPVLRAWVAPAVLAAVLAFAGCAGPPVQHPEPVVAEPQPSAPLGETTGSRSFDEVLEAARRALGQKDYREAARVAREAGRLAPDPGAARLLEAEARQAMGDGAGALPLWQSAVETGPDRARVWAAYAELAVHRGAGEAALEVFAQRFSVLPGGEDPEPTLSGIAGWTALAVGRGARAAVYLERTVGTPAEGAFALALGRARLLVGAFGGAEEAARRAVAGTVAGEETAQGWLLLGDVHREQGLAAGARVAYEKVLELDPENYAARVNLAVLTLQQGDAEAAIELLEAAAENHPAAPEAWHDLGLARRSLAHWDAAREAYETALNVDPGYTPALKNLGILIEKYLGRPAEALPYYDQYLKWVPDDVEVQRWRKNAERLAGQERG